MSSAEACTTKASRVVHVSGSSVFLRACQSHGGPSGHSAAANVGCILESVGIVAMLGIMSHRRRAVQLSLSRYPRCRGLQSEIDNLLYEARTEIAP